MAHQEGFSTARSHWKTRMECHLKIQVEMWIIIQIGFSIPSERDGSPQSCEFWNAATRKKIEPDAKATQTLHCGLTKEELNRVGPFSSAKDLWTKFIELHEGTSNIRLKIVGVADLPLELELFSLWMLTSALHQHLASDIGMQKLRGALKVLSDTEKQLRSSKNQATWLTVALLQLSTLESSPFTEVNSSCPSLEMPYLRDDARLSMTNVWDGKNSICYSLNQNKQVCSDRNCSRKKLESIWRQVTQRCQSNSFKIFLQQEGCLSAVYVHQGVTVAEIDFCNPEHVSRAAKSQELIACALQHVLGRNLEIRIKFVPKSTRKVAKTSKSSFGLLSCSGRKKELSLSTISDEGEIDTSEKIESSSKIYSSHHSRKFSPFVSQSAGDQLANGVEMKEMISPTTDDNAHYAESEAEVDGQGRMQKDGKVDADPSGKLGEMSEYVKIPEPEIQPNCFSRRLKFQRRFFSSNTAPTICFRIPQQNRSELSIPDNEASATYFCMYDPYTLNSSSTSHFTCSSREENIACKDSKVRPKLFCWKMPKPQVFD
ncbi:uncharacterized protein LOC141831690 [Curcuma longa]|uniref:uncharacterized protein LOC141831690 n=1 Tax=Curcuma longa TaxID=136217 RepID=UPI003D9E7417